MEFTGFTEEQFDVFDIPEFGARMAAIRELVRPSLLAAGQSLAPRLSDLIGSPIYPHVALHARRRVNPPDDTWVAFGRCERGYKAFAHLAVGIESAGVYAALVLKSEAEDRAILGELLLQQPEEFLGEWGMLDQYEAREAPGLPASRLSPDTLARLGKALRSLKTGCLHLLSRVPRSDIRLASGNECLEHMEKRLQPVIPVYLRSVG